MTILGIETSCDETAAAVVAAEDGKPEVLSDVVFSQIDIHRKYGGVVPEVAAREHAVKIIPVIDEALEKAGIKKGEVREKLDAIAVTAGPGLITSLLAGVETAKSLASVWKTPLVAVNHIEGHIYANFISKKDTDIKLPALILTVSGGHTNLVLMRGHGDLKVIGETRDDAAGEAFDKAAKLLELGYPGGPAISEAAQKAGEDALPELPRPMMHKGGLDFSFSGLKTALLYAVRDDKRAEKRTESYAHEFESAVVDVLTTKTVRAALEHDTPTVMLSGGVAANRVLREKMKERLSDKLPDTKLLMPDMAYTTDNAAMIATAGYFRARRNEFTPPDELTVDCNLQL